MEPHPKRIKPTRIDDTGENGKQSTAIEKNTDSYTKLIDSYEEIFKSTLTPDIRERLIAKARLSFKNCSKSFKQSSELRRLLENPKSLQPLQHLEIIFKQFKANKKVPAAHGSNSSGKDNETSVENDRAYSENYNTDLFEKFLEIVKERKTSQGNYAETEKLMIKAWAFFNNCKSSYKKSPAFEELLRKSVNLSAVDPIIQLKTVLDELKFNKKVVCQPVETRVNDPCCSSSTAQETTSENIAEKPEENDSDDDSLSGVDPKVRKKVKMLEKTLRALNLRIKHLEEREIDFTEEDDENSAYIKLDRYYRRFDQVYAKICELKKQKADAGRVVKRKVTFPGGDIERAIEKHYNKTNQFPDFHDVLKITEEVKKKERLPPNKLHSIAQNVFEEFGKLLQRRRQMDVYESACAYLTNNDPAEEDLELKAKLEENYNNFKDSEKKVIDMYAEKSHGIEPEEVGSNISNNEEEDEEEEENGGGTRDGDKRNSNNPSDHSTSPEREVSCVLSDDDSTLVEDGCIIDSEEQEEKRVSSPVESNTGNSSDTCSTKDKKVPESSDKVQCESKRQNEREVKAECTSGNSSTVCLSKDIVVSKDSESGYVEEKEPDIFSPGKGGGEEKIESTTGNSSNVAGSAKGVAISSVSKHYKQESNNSTPRKDGCKEEVECGKSSNFNLTEDITVTGNCKSVNFEKKESCRFTSRKEGIDKKFESNTEVSSNLDTIDITMIDDSESLSMNNRESCSLSTRKDEKVESTPGNSLAKDILVCNPINNDEEKSGSLAPDKMESKKTVDNSNIETNSRISSPSKRISSEHSISDGNLKKSGNNAQVGADRKRKHPSENETDDKFENKLFKLPEHHLSLTGEKSSRTSTDDIEVIEALSHSVTFPNKENVKRSKDQTKPTETDKCIYKNNGCKQLKFVSDSAEKKKLNSTSVNNSASKVVGMTNSSTTITGVNNSSTNAAGIKNGAFDVVNLKNNPTNLTGVKNCVTNGATNVLSLKRKSSNVACARNSVIDVKNSKTNVTGVNNSRSSVPGAGNISTTAWSRKIPASNTNFKNISQNTSSPIITSVFSLEKSNNSSKHNMAATTLPNSQTPQQRDVMTSGPGVTTKYRTTSTANKHQMSLKRKAESHNSNRLKNTAMNVSGQTSSSTSSSSPKLKDVIVIDECEDDSQDLCIVSEVRSSNKLRNPVKQEASLPHCLSPASKLLHGDKIKYISGEKTKQMLKDGNVKVFSRFKTKPPPDKSKTDSVITLD